MPNPPREPLFNQSLRSLQMNKPDQRRIKTTNNLLAIRLLKRRASNDTINPRRNHRLDNATHRHNPRRTIEIGERLPAMHLALALLAMKIITIAKFPAKRRRQHSPNRRFP